MPNNGSKIIINGDSVFVEIIEPKLHSIKVTDGVLVNSSMIGIANLDTFGIPCDGSKFINNGTLLIAESGGEVGSFNSNRSAIVMDNSEFINSSFIQIQNSGFGVILNNSTFNNNSKMSINTNSISLGILTGSYVNNSNLNAEISANRKVSLLFGSSLDNRGSLNFTVADMSTSSNS